MALITLRELLDHAAENDYGVPAYNVNNLEQTQAVLEAANETGSQLSYESAGARKYAGVHFKAFSFGAQEVSAYSNS